MKLYLAPMEGVVDSILREILTSLGGIDQCVSEFLRVTNQVYPDKVFFKYCPELKNQGVTLSGVPVFLQLLGGQAEPLAANAFRAAELGASGIDLNFGCPAKTVNRHDGGATLLKYPERLFNIVKEVRGAVPKKIPVTAKIRLGYDDPSQCFENAKAIEEAGATWITIHCRTKTDGYKPPAYWEWIPQIRNLISIKIIANGEISTIEDFFKCKEVTQSSDFMIGRGAISNPFVFKMLKEAHDHKNCSQPTPEEARKLLEFFFQKCQDSNGPAFAVARSKQWLKYTQKTFISLVPLFEKIRTVQNPQEFYEHLSTFSIDP